MPTVKSSQGFSPAVTSEESTSRLRQCKVCKRRRRRLKVFNFWWTTDDDAVEWQEVGELDSFRGGVCLMQQVFAKEYKCCRRRLRVLLSLLSNLIWSWFFSVPSTKEREFAFLAVPEPSLLRKVFSRMERRSNRRSLWRKACDERRIGNQWLLNKNCKDPQLPLVVLLFRVLLLMLLCDDDVLWKNLPRGRKRRMQSEEEKKKLYYNHDFISFPWQKM